MQRKRARNRVRNLPSVEQTQNIAEQADLLGGKIRPLRRAHRGRLLLQKLHSQLDGGLLLCVAKPLPKIRGSSSGRWRGQLGGRQGYRIFIYIGHGTTDLTNRDSG